jgi:hypothetical protein
VKDGSRSQNIEMEDRRCVGCGHGAIRLGHYPNATFGEWDISTLNAEKRVYASRLHIRGVSIRS